MTIPDRIGSVVSRGLDPCETLKNFRGAPHTAPSSMSTATWDAARLIAGTLGGRSTVLGSFGASEADRQHLLAHLGRKTLQGTVTRDFKTAWINDADGNTVPKLYRVETEAMRRCQYVVLAHKQRASVVVIDIDRRGHSGGHVEDIHPEVYDKLSLLAAGNISSSWIGVNPINGKCQLIWLIDPVYADSRADSANIRLMKLVTTMLGDYLGGDAAFAHRLSRSPFYNGDDPTAYRWHVQHHRIDRLSHLRDEVRTLTGQPAPERSTPAKQNFSSGRELINAVRSRREQAQQARDILSSLENDLPNAEALDGDRIDGVKVLWITEGRAARDETAFRHALATAHRLREAGERMTDAKIIDAYERAYNLAQAVGADNREPELPPMRDRLTMARRVRGYVLGNKRSSSSGTSVGGAGSATARERKALATMGRKGGQKASQRWKTDPDGEYAQGRRSALQTANAKREMQGELLSSKVKMAILEARTQGVSDPSSKELADTLGTSVRRIQQIRKQLGMKAKRGRPNKSETP